MDVNVTHTFPAPLDRVWALQGDPDYLVEKLTDLGNEDVEATATPNGDGVTIVLKMTVAAELPGFAAKVLPAKSRITTTYAWEGEQDGVRKGTWKVESGTPVTASGQMSLTEKDGATEERITGQVKCGVPLIGGKIADFVGKESVKTIREDQAYTDKRLANG